MVPVVQPLSSTSRCRRKLFYIPNNSSGPVLEEPLCFRPTRPRLTTLGHPSSHMWSNHLFQSHSTELHTIRRRFLRLSISDITLSCMTTYRLSVAGHTRPLWRNISKVSTIIHHSTSFSPLINISYHIQLYDHISTVRGWSYSTTSTKYYQSIYFYTPFDAFRPKSPWKISDK